MLYKTPIQEKAEQDRYRLPITKTQKVMHYSKNKKLNAVLNEIETDLLSIHDTPEESLSEIRHYADNFRYEIDLNLAQYGEVLIYYWQIREMYERCGYKSIVKYSNNKLWETYKRPVGYVARRLLKANRDN